MRTFRFGGRGVGLASMLAAATVGAAAVPYPGPAPGAWHTAVSDRRLVFTNQSLSATWSASPGWQAPELVDRASGRVLRLTGPVFRIVLEDGTVHSPETLRSEGRPARSELPTRPSKTRQAAARTGSAVEARFLDPEGRFAVAWRILGEDGANYVRQELELTGLKEETIVDRIVWAEASATDGRTVGNVDGSVAVVGPFFLACEDPHSANRAGAASLACSLTRKAPLKAGERLRLSLVTGIFPQGQLRRAFLHYVERERAHPYRPFLHYNSWYDTAWEPFALNETNCLEAIRIMGDRFIRPHRVKVDAMVFDDGWDDPATLWQFHAGFPRGFAPLASACEEYQTRLGVWLSPFGGYGEPRERRLRFGREQGYEINDAGFSLAGPKYYTAFKAACVRMMRDYGVNHFKFDGIATGMYASGGGQYLRDTEAMRRLMLELREEDPDVYINLTTGSWPSPFWLRYADSVWRQGGDMGHAGKGSRQQQWLTYRDQETFRNIVRKGPLYPLNALMSQGVAYSRQGMAGDPTFNSAGFKDDVQAFFASGTSLQELYIQPGKLTGADWAVLAEAAKWARDNADVLVDTHWVGGDPGALEVYGYASWSPRKGILMLRNPDDQPRVADVDLGRVFELPPGAAREYTLHCALSGLAEPPQARTRAGEKLTFMLKPFEIVVVEAHPAPSTGDTTAPKVDTALVPRPGRWTARPGGFEITRETALVCAAAAPEGAGVIAEELRLAIGLPLPVREDDRPGTVRAEWRPELIERLGPEGYRLEITPEQVRLQAGSRAGLFYAGITLRQMLPPGGLLPRGEGGKPASASLPAGEIEDAPRFAWRGLLLDPARHFLPLDFVKKFIDVMALHKLNRLQLHLTDDQGWRVEIRKYPRLTAVGSVRKESPRRGARDQGDGERYGPFFYTQAELRELVAYARARHVTLVPEIEIPGHFTAALAAYPEFSCTGGPFEVRTRWGIEEDVLCAGNDEAVRFILGVLDEVTEVFPGEFVHIGGDEAPRGRWKECPECQARMRAEGLTREAQLQTWLNQKMEQFLAQRGRRLIGWDEILEGGLTGGAAVMSWRGMEGGLAAAQAGHDVVMSPTTHCYLDYAQAKGPKEPESIGGFIPLETVYAFEPIPPTLSGERRHHILGGQGNLWSEYLWNGREVEYFAFPRAAALAEVLWSPAEGRRFPDFQRRWFVHAQRLEALGVNYRRDPGTIAPPAL